MTVATVHIFEGTGTASAGAATTNTDVDGSTFKFGMADAVDASASPLAVPTAAGTNFSYAKAFFLRITVAATTSSNLLNRKVKIDTQPTGLSYFFKAINSGSYAQNTAAADTSTGSNGSIPTGYTALSSTYQTYDSASVASTGTGQNGKYCYVAAAVDNTYVAGGGLSASTVFSFAYDES